MARFVVVRDRRKGAQGRRSSVSQMSRYSSVHGSVRLMSIRQCKVRCMGEACSSHMCRCQSKVRMNASRTSALDAPATSRIHHIKVRQHALTVPWLFPRALDSIFCLFLFHRFLPGRMRDVLVVSADYCPKAPSTRPLCLVCLLEHGALA